MRRVGMIALALVAAAGVAFVALTGVGAQANDAGRVDIVVDDAKGMVAGQSVKVAGATVGEIKAIKLLSTRGGGYRARMKLSVESRFLPFTADAKCSILPQGLISENFVDCDPGARGEPPLADDAGVPVLGVERTTVPASLQDILNVFAVPTSQRVRILINELGLATSGRGTDLNRIIRRANPALTQTSRVMSIVDRQSDRLEDAVAETDRVLGTLAEHERGVESFVRNAATTARTTAAHRGALGAGVRRLPALLTSLQDSLAPVQRITEAGTPLLRRLRTSARPLDLLTARIPRFIEPATASLHAVRKTARTGRRALPGLRPLVADLDILATKSQPPLEKISKLLVNSRDAGVLDEIGNFFYGMSIGGSAYDEISHEAVAALDVYPTCILTNILPGTQVTPGCSHAYSAPGLGRIPASNLPQSAAAKKARSNPNALSDLLDYLLK